jgi:hypothetical protein
MLIYKKQAKTNLEKDDYDLNWESEKEITREEKNNIENALKDYDYKIPSDIMRFIFKHYYDKIIPSISKDAFDTEDLPGIRIYDFFNFNPLITSSRQLTYDIYQNGNCENYDKSAIEGTVFERNKLYPIIWASHEMIICCDSKGCIFMVCPEETVTKIADSFDEFLGKLYMNN